ncbi:MAG: outer membrane protein [Hyphomicrobium sp.]
MKHPLGSPCSRLRPCALASLLLLFAASSADANPLSASWTGLYGGVHGGANWVDVDTSSLGNFYDSAASYGLHAGYNVGLGGFVVGIEGDASFDGSELSFSTGVGGTANFETDWRGTVRGRFGLSLGPALLYATAGYAWTAATLSDTDVNGGRTTFDQTFHGVVYGVGVESYVLPNISLRLEALRYDYGAEDISFRGANSALESFDPSDTVVRAGITFHLN